ncbi:MAG TPA: dTDP-4-dehydrorhamnose 3,5-epimerase [Sphingomicrobium sp.]|nr:dTDP-4-dehydrorhamnose 3,5-epimerase [Sphingomicrobium sp.]
MEFRDFELQGLLEIIPRKIEDDRGYFSEIFRLNKFEELVPGVEFVQDNQSLSVRTGTIRGLHFQTHPAAQGKLVRCLAGELVDVAVDLRNGSPTFGHWISVVLSPEKNNQLWVPVGFAHGFCTLEPNTVISYRVTNYYSAENDKGVAWDDPQIGIKWPEVADLETLSPKDGRQPRLADLPAYFSMENQ